MGIYNWLTDAIRNPKIRDARLDDEFSLTDGIISLSHFGAANDGVTDDYNALAAAVAFANVTGATIHAPGKYLFNMTGRSTITLTGGAIVGSGGVGFFQPSPTELQGTWFLIKGTTASPITLGGRASIRYIKWLWPDQTNPAAPTTYPAAITLINGSTVVEVSGCTFTNAFTAIYLSDTAGGNGDVHIFNNYIAAFSAGIVIEAASLNNWIFKNEFHWSAGYNFYETGASLNASYPSGQGSAWIAYVQAHTIGIRFVTDHADAQVIEGNIFGGLHQGVLASSSGSETFIWADINGNFFDSCDDCVTFSGKFRPSQVAIRGGVISGQTGNAFSRGILLSLSGSAQFSLIVEGVQFGSVGQRHIHIDTASGQPGDVQITGCRFIQPDDSESCIYCDADTTDLTVSGNVFDGSIATTPNAIFIQSARSVTINGNTLKDLDKGIIVGGGGTISQHLVVTGNTATSDVTTPVSISGTVSGNAVLSPNSWTHAAFRAYKSANQTGITDATDTKVTFTSEVFDNGSHYDAANSKWTPPAGRVLLSVHILLDSGTTMAAGSLVVAEIYKNGTGFAKFFSTVAVANSFQGAGGCVVDDANGTDYYEVYCFIDTTGGNATVTGIAGGTHTFFSGAYLSGQ